MTNTTVAKNTNKKDPFAQMSAFVDPEAREPVRDEYGNTVWIRQKMGLAIRAKVQKDLASIEFDLTPDGDLDRTHATAKMSPQDRRNIMFRANVVDWAGPAFEREVTLRNGKTEIKPIPFDPSLIAHASEHPIWEQVYERLNELNQTDPIIEEDGDEMLDPKSERS
jgi:hypothetical protein